MNNGYSEKHSITIDNPHYGWKIGNFFLSGYTRETKADNKLILLKNVGDEITLRFKLDQDINKINGQETLSIANDGKGYNQYFQTLPMNMGRGTLIVRLTDHNKIKHEPEIYTNYLEANAITNASTVVNFFEEGDYEVALNYKLKYTPRSIFGFDIIPEYYDYQIAFEFSVRNGNTMVFPFDITTGEELADKAITPNGFKLDMAKSKYLKIDVTKSVLTESESGLVEDVRFNRPAQDGEQYVEEGIYTFDVSNLYTGQNTKKTIYVGESVYLQSLAEGFSVMDLNNETEENSLTITED